MWHHDAASIVSKCPKVLYSGLAFDAILVVIVLEKSDPDGSSTCVLLIEPQIVAVLIVGSLGDCG